RDAAIVIADRQRDEERSCRVVRVDDADILDERRGPPLALPRIRGHTVVEEHLRHARAVTKVPGCGQIVAAGISKAGTERDARVQEERREVRLGPRPGGPVSHVEVVVNPDLVAIGEDDDNPSGVVSPRPTVHRVIVRRVRERRGHMIMKRERDEARRRRLRGRAPRPPDQIQGREDAGVGCKGEREMVPFLARHPCPARGFGNAIELPTFRWAVCVRDGGPRRCDMRAVGYLDDRGAGEVVGVRAATVGFGDHVVSNSPSPVKSHRKESESPSGSLERVALRRIVSPSCPVYGPPASGTGTPTATMSTRGAAEVASGTPFASMSDRAREGSIRPAPSAGETRVYDRMTGS